MPKNRKLAQISLVIASVVLVGVFSLVILEKNNVTKLFTNSDTSQGSAGARPINDVAYTPATTTEQEEGDRIKQNLIEESNKVPQTTSKINVSLSAATQDVAGGPLVVRSIVSASSGSCKLTLTQGSTKKELTSEITNLGTYFSCGGFDIPTTDLNNGKWQLNLSVTNSQEYGEVSQEVNIAK